MTIRLSLAAALAAALTVGLGSAPARADFTFGYSATPTILATTTPAGVVSNINGSGTNPGSATYEFTSATGTTKVSFTGLGSGSNVLAADPLTYTPFTQVTIDSNDPIARDYNIAFSVDYTLFDSGTNSSAVVNFGGILSGVVSSRTAGASFKSFVPGVGVETLVTVGGKSFYVSLDSFSNPGLINPGGFTAQVRGVPEPGSIALVGMGFVGVAFAMRHRRQVARARAAA